MFSKYLASKLMKPLRRRLEALKNSEDDGGDDDDYKTFRVLFCTDLYPDSDESMHSRRPLISMLEKSLDDGDEEEDDGDDDDDDDRKESKKCEITERFLRTVSKMLLSNVTSNFDPIKKVLDFDWTSEELNQKVDLILEIGDESESLENVLVDWECLMKGCLKIGHPRLLDSASSALDVVSLLGEWVTATANTNMFTYEIAPVFTLIEDIVLTRMKMMIGWQAFEGDGIFAPGASISNMYALAVARHKLIPEVRFKGMSHVKDELVLFVTSQSDGSVEKAASLLGIGCTHVLRVQCNQRGQMMAEDLKIKIQAEQEKGHRPFFVSAVSGSEMFGAFDPLSDVADVCDRYNLWLHVDASFGGCVLFSSNHDHLMRGIRRAHSVTWNLDTFMTCALQCSAILIKEKSLLEACNSSNATYLFQQDKHYDITYDTGDKAIQCGRHNDVFKLWLLWRSRGDAGMGLHVDRLFQLSRYLQDALRVTSGFEPLMPEFEYLMVSFWYIPEKMRKSKEERMDVENETAEFQQKLSGVTQNISEELRNEGKCLVGVFKQHLSSNNQQHSLQQSIKEQKWSDKQQLKLTNNPQKHQLNHKSQQQQQQQYHQQRQQIQQQKIQQQEQEQVMFFRIVLSNAYTEYSDIDFVLSEIIRHGEALNI